MLIVWFAYWFSGVWCCLPLDVCCECLFMTCFGVFAVYIFDIDVCSDLDIDLLLWVAF